MTAKKILLICDDNPSAISIKGQLINLGGYDVIVESVIQAGASSLRQHLCDLVFIWHAVPEIDIIPLILELRKADPDCVIVVLFRAGQASKANELAGLGVFECMVEPVSAEKLKFIVEKGINLHGLLMAGRRLTQGLIENNHALEGQNMLLAKRIEDSSINLSRLYGDLRSTYMRTIRVLAQAIDARDHYTHSHSENVARYAVIIANQLNRLSAKDVELIRQACELHDLGKIGIVDSILLKASALTPSEWEQIKKHPVIGAQILEPLTFLNSAVEFIRQHHEHYDGSGYPEGRKGEDIFLGARIIHVADAYEAMRSARSYRKIPLMKEEAVSEIRRNSGTQFDPRIVDIFLKVAKDL